MAVTIEATGVLVFGLSIVIAFGSANDAESGPIQDHTCVA
jgi:hypothetical protein